MFQYEAQVLDVVDGDTMKLMVDMGFYIFHRTTVRLARINAPETVVFTTQGIEDPAREFILERCGPGTVVVVDILKADKYGRWLAEVRYLPGSVRRDEIVATGRNLNDELLQMGLVEPYRA